jgi:hypothetical protein
MKDSSDVRGEANDKEVISAWICWKCICNRLQ